MLFISGFLAGLAVAFAVMGLERGADSEVLYEEDAMPVSMEKVALDDLCEVCRREWGAFMRGERYGFIPCRVCDDKLKMTLAASTHAN